MEAQKARIVVVQMAHVGGNSGNDQHDEVPVVKGIGTDTKLWVIVSPVPTKTTVPEMRELRVKEEKVRLGEAGMEKENVATGLLHSIFFED